MNSRHPSVFFLAFAFAVVLMIQWTVAQASAPQGYSLTQVTSMTEASLFGAGASNLKVYRSGSKELVELTIAPSGANRNGVHVRYLFDFQAHKAYSRDITNNACSWTKYVSARAPIWYDPITALDDAARAQLDREKQHVGATETVNGIPAVVIESAAQGGKTRTWIAQKGDFPVKMALQTPDGTVQTLMEVTQVDFSPQAASLFVPPTNCDTQSQGEWSDTRVSSHAEAEIDVKGTASANSATGRSQAQITATRRQTSPSSGPQSPAAGSQQNPGTGPAATTGKVVVKAGGEVLPLKPEEQTAFKFVRTIDSLEGDCRFSAAEPCTLEVLIRGPKPKDADRPVGKLKFDPNATDSNYTYTVVLDNGDWTIWANPRKPGLGGFYIKKGLHGGTWYNPAGPATEKDTSISESMIDMDFRLRK